MNILEINKIYKEYDNQVVVDSISLNIKKGEIHGILGPNGAGKSTLIGMICGLIKPTFGSIKYEDKTNDIRKCKEKIGIVPQDFALYLDLTALDNVKFFASLYGYKGLDLNNRCKRVLEFVGLFDVKDKVVSTFSGGMKRRLNIACAITHSPKLIIMDEPTVGIDPQSRNHILNSVVKLRDEGATIIYTSHYMQEVDDICDRISIVDLGKIIAEGTSLELKNLVGDKRVINITINKMVQGISEKIMEIAGVENVKYMENIISITTVKSINPIGKIVQLITDTGADILNINNEELSLETVFLALTGKKLRE